MKKKQLKQWHMVSFRAGDSVALTSLLDNGLDSDTSFRLGGGTR